MTFYPMFLVTSYFLCHILVFHSHLKPACFTEALTCPLAWLAPSPMPGYTLLLAYPYQGPLNCHIKTSTLI